MITTAEQYLSIEQAYPPYAERTEAQQAELKAVLRTLSDSERYRVRRLGVEAYFTLENLGEEHACHTSPSGRYILRLRPCGTRPGAWNYTLGSVYEGDRLIAEIKRNYSSFPYQWVEGHPTGADFLICGEDYQGQTVIELNTGGRRDYFPPEAENGHGFCWASVSPNEDKTKLLVTGCYWACPYEYRIYDFSDPMNKGWTWLQHPYMDEDANSHVSLVGDVLTYIENNRHFIATGESEDALYAKYFALTRGVCNVNNSPEEKARYKALQDAHRAQYPDEDEDAHLWELRPKHRIISKFNGEAYEVMEEWKSDEVLEGERKRREYDAQWAADSRRYRAESPFYLWARDQFGRTDETMKDVMYFILPSINMKDNGEVNPAFFHLYTQEPREGARRRGSIEWGVLHGDLKLEKWQYGVGSTTETFPRTMEGFQQAFAAGAAWGAQS